MTTVEFQKDEEKLVCFVNANKPPDEIVKYPVFRYSKIGVEEKLAFEQLVAYKYLHEDMIWYTVLTWEAIMVRTPMQAMFVQLCDSMTGLAEAIK
jgi:hypothetical protein